jgi:hypothetical protein
MTLLEVLGEVRELPSAVENAPELARFEDFLVQRGELTEPQARALTGTLVASLLESVGNRVGADMLVHLNAIVELRATLRVRYAEVVRSFRGPGTPAALPEHLQPEAFRDLFNQLGDELEALRNPVGRAVDALDDPANLVGLDQLGAHAPELAPEDSAPNLVTDELPQERRWTPSGYEQQRVELDWYRDALQGNPDPQLRAAAEASLQAFMARFQPPNNWQLRLRRIPQYGYTLEQIRALAARDPDFAARGFEVAINVPQGLAPWAQGPRGATFVPDAVMQGPRGYLLLEYKTSWAPEPAGFYSSPAGRAVLRADVVARARMSLELPGCGGWGYKTGSPWLDEAIASVLDDVRLEEPELGARIHMLELE